MTIWYTELKCRKHQSIIPSMNLAIKREGKRSEPNKEYYDRGSMQESNENHTSKSLTS